MERARMGGRNGEEGADGKEWRQGQEPPTPLEAASTLACRGLHTTLSTPLCAHRPPHTLCAGPDPPSTHLLGMLEALDAVGVLLELLLLLLHRVHVQHRAHRALSVGHANIPEPGRTCHG
eukprot:1186707-Rhodomonas_salina.2